NTVRLLVAEVTAGTAAWRTVHAEQRVTRLGEGLRARGTLGDAAAARTAAAVVAYVARARAAGAARVAVVATSAVREAANGRAFVTDLARGHQPAAPAAGGAGPCRARRLAVPGTGAGGPHPSRPRDRRRHARSSGLRAADRERLELARGDPGGAGGTRGLTGS